MTNTIIDKSKLSLDFEKFPYTISRNGIKKENFPTSENLTVGLKNFLFPVDGQPCFLL